MYTSPSEWAISKYSISFEIIPGLIPSHFKGHLRDTYLQEHTWIHLHFKNCHKCQSDYSPGQSAPIWLLALLLFPPPKSSVNLSPRRNLLYQRKQPLGGLSAPQRRPHLARAHKEDGPGLPCHLGHRMWDGSGGSSAPRAILGNFKFS